MSNNEDYLTARDAAQRLSVSVRTIHRMASDGRLAVTLRVPGRRGALLFTAAAVETARTQQAA